jgi:hypothetical protein
MEEFLQLLAEKAFQIDAVISLLAVDEDLQLLADIRKYFNLKRNTYWQDVKWTDSVPDRVAVAATNGKIVFFSVYSHKIELVASEHDRSINKIAALVEERLLLSGSQDGVTKLWVRCVYCRI